MNQTQHKMAFGFAQFIGMAVFILLFIVGIVFFSYLLIFGAVVGLILFGVGYIRAKIMRSKRQKQGKYTKPAQGRTIEYKDIP